MKITKTKLKRIIKEEIARALKESGYRQGQAPMPLYDKSKSEVVDELYKTHWREAFGSDDPDAEDLANFAPPNGKFVSWAKSHIKLIRWDRSPDGAIENGWEEGRFSEAEEYEYGDMY